MTRENAAGPLSRRFDASSVRDAGTGLRIEATEAERAALARDCDLPAVDALAADLVVRRDGAAGLRVTGGVTARLRRICVVTLDEFPVELSEPVDVAYAPEAEVEAAAAARAARPAADEGEEDDLPDPIVGGRVDLGALTAEIFALGLDPYPRKPGVAFEAAAAPEPTPDDSPFAALRRLGREGRGDADG